MDVAKRRIGRPRGTGSQRVYDQVRKMILNLRLPPGADLDESSLEREFEVSRTPVREALIRLASEGLVTLLPNRGARVTPLDVSDVPQMFEALEVFQRVATRWSALRRRQGDINALRRHCAEFADAAEAKDIDRMGECNKAFHLTIAEACGNKYIARQYEGLLSASLRLARMVFASAATDTASQNEYYDEVVRHHDEMVEAIAHRDAARADALARDHTRLFRTRVVKYIEANLADEVTLET